jgi:hypothetical protein
MAIVGVALCRCVRGAASATNIIVQLPYTSIPVNDPCVQRDFITRHLLLVING